MSDTPTNISGDSKPAPINIQVVGCDAQPCTVKRGESVVVLVDFEAGKHNLSLFNE
jgi:hypothetical protein